MRVREQEICVRDVTHDRLERENSKRRWNIRETEEVPGSPRGRVANLQEKKKNILQETKH